MTEEVIRTEGVAKILPGEVPAMLVQDVSISVGRGEFVAVTGPSGSGKSSLLYLLGLLDSPTSGTVFVGGRDTSKLKDKELALFRLANIGFVFQFHFLLWEFSVLQNVALPMRKLGRLSEDAAEARAGKLLADLGLGTQLKKTPDQLSGGQRQRVAIARALANDPLVMLGDEPTGNLDTKSSANVISILKDLAANDRRTIVVVTHDPEFARRADRRIHIVDGRVVPE